MTPSFPGGAQSESCKYTAQPTTSANDPNPKPSPTTDYKGCQVCTPAQANEDSCTSLTSCVVQTGAVTIEAGSSSVHVGTLTSTALYTSISSALDKLCPSVTQTTSNTYCETGTVEIKNIPYAKDDNLNTGKLVVSVQSSLYNDSSLRQAMISAAALTANTSAQNQNCYQATYADESALSKRDLLYALLPRSLRPSGESKLMSWIPKRLRPRADGQATWCNAVGFAGVQYFNPWWKLQQSPSVSDYIDALWEFEGNGGGDFECGMLEGMIDAMAVVAPEFAVGDIELGEAIDVGCEAALSAFANKGS